jgi:hypothetical protein
MRCRNSTRNIVAKAEIEFFRMAVVRGVQAGGMSFRGGRFNQFQRGGFAGTDKFFNGRLNNFNDHFFPVIGFSLIAVSSQIIAFSPIAVFSGLMRSSAASDSPSGSDS